MLGRRKLPQVQGAAAWCCPGAPHVVPRVRCRRCRWEGGRALPSVATCTGSRPGEDPWRCHRLRPRDVAGRRGGLRLTQEGRNNISGQFTQGNVTSSWFDNTWERRSEIC